MSSEVQIQAYFGFDQTDLNANRFGKFSQKQKEALMKADRSVSRSLLFLGLAFLGVGIWRGIVLFNAQGQWADWILPVVLVGIAGWLFSGVVNKVDRSVEVAEGVVEFVKVVNKTGFVSDAEIDRNSITSYEMQVGGVVFSNANPALIPYMQGDTYAVYYTNSTHQILSVALISKNR
jgi:hypothetical protein